MLFATFTSVSPNCYWTLSVIIVTKIHLTIYWDPNEIISCLFIAYTFKKNEIEKLVLYRKVLIGFMHSFRHWKVNTGLNVLPWLGSWFNASCFHQSTAPPLIYVAHSSFPYHTVTNCCRGVGSVIGINLGNSEKWFGWDCACYLDICEQYYPVCSTLVLHLFAFIWPSVHSNHYQMSSFPTKQYIASYYECDLLDKLKYCKHV